MYYMHNMCIVCLRDNNNLNTVFHKGKEIFMQVKYVLPELTISDSANSMTICSSCYITLNSLYTSKRKCLKNCSRLRYYTQIFKESNATQETKIRQSVSYKSE